MSVYNALVHHYILLVENVCVYNTEKINCIGLQLVPAWAAQQGQLLVNKNAVAKMGTNVCTFPPPFFSTYYENGWRHTFSVVCGHSL
jgi:hypothetical protein